MKMHLPTASRAPAQAGSIAAELVHAYHQMVTFHRDQLGLSALEADAQARGTDLTEAEVDQARARILSRPPDQVTWAEMLRLAERDPDAMLAILDDLTNAARDELESGHRAAQALDWQRRPFARARFLAIRESFREGTPPTTGIEAALIDVAAEAHGDYLELSEQLHRMLGAEVEIQRDDLERDGRWRPTHEVTDAAIARVERRATNAHKRFLQTVKALHELQRSSHTLFVGHAGQINVGQQQVNFRGPAAAGYDAPDDLSK
jgi:hypothetical protein